MGQTRSIASKENINAVSVLTTKKGATIDNSYQLRNVNGIKAPDTVRDGRTL